MMVQVMSGGCISSGSVAKTCCGHDRCPKTSGPATYETNMFSWRKEKCYTYIIIMLVGYHMHICIIFIPWHCSVSWISYAYMYHIHSVTLQYITLPCITLHCYIKSDHTISYHIISYHISGWKWPAHACADKPGVQEVHWQTSPPSFRSKALQSP